MAAHTFVTLARVPHDEPRRSSRMNYLYIFFFVFVLFLPHHACDDDFSELAFVTRKYFQQLGEQKREREKEKCWDAPICCAAQRKINNFVWTLRA